MRMGVKSETEGRLSLGKQKYRSIKSYALP